MEASTTRTSSYLGSRRLASGVVVTLAKGGGRLVLDDASSGVIMYIEGGVHCRIRGRRGCSSFEPRSTENYGTVDEDPTCSSYGRTKHNDGRHDLVKDTCDAGKVRVVCLKTRTCSLGS